MLGRVPVYRDRADAGRVLAEALGHVRDRDILVLALPRGGVPIAAEVARALRADLDVLVVRKLGVPSHPEFGFGAIAQNAEWIDEDTVRALELTQGEIGAVMAQERRELARREATYRGDRPAPSIRGRTVIVVDDGIATGGTARAALLSVRREQPSRLILAAPVGPTDAQAQLSGYADEIVIARTPPDLRAIGLWYEDFSQTTDEEVLAILGAARREMQEKSEPHVSDVAIHVQGGTVSGTLAIPPSPLGIVVFAHGSGSSRRSPRSQYVARVLQSRGLATLLMDLLTPEEERVDDITREHRFDLPLLSRRLTRAAEWARAHPETRGLSVGYFGSSTGGGAALIAAAADPASVRAVVSRGGRPDLARDALPLVEAPTLFIVGERDETVLDLNVEAKERMTVDATIHVVPGATHLFEEPGALEEVAGVAADWFARHLATHAPQVAPKEI